MKKARKKRRKEGRDGGEKGGRGKEKKKPPTFTDLFRYFSVSEETIEDVVYLRTASTWAQRSEGLTCSLELVSSLQLGHALLGRFEGNSENSCFSKQRTKSQMGLTL